MYSISRDLGLRGESDFQMIRGRLLSRHLRPTDPEEELMSMPIRPRALALAATTALLIGTPAVLAHAGPSRFYACVKKNGAARIAKKKLRCRKGETKLSWSSSGPAGRNGVNGVNGANSKDGSSGPAGVNGTDGAHGTDGVNGKDGANGANGTNGVDGNDGTNGVDGKDGTNGTNGVAGKDGTNGTNGVAGKDGTNGAVAGFATAPMTEGVMFTTASEGSPQTVVSMTLPAGNYIANAKVEARLSDSKAGGFANIECRLVPTPTGGGTAAFDTSGWAALIDIPFLSFHVAQNTLPLALAIDSPGAPSTASLVCWVAVKEDAGGTLTAEANNASITAVQTAGNS
jgi:hypothetical protein